MMQKHTITTQKTARYFQIGEINTETKHIIIALHGYAQMANYFLKWFENSNYKQTVIIAPEGLHRFYWEGFSGKVVASWMTKEARLDDIEDNINYLNQVYKQFVGKQNFDKIIVLGFSQGAATAARWIEKTEFQIDAFIQWAGVFPPDLEINANNSKWQSLKHYYVVGNQDPYFAENSNDEYNQSAWLNKHNFHPETITFEGKHDIDAATLNQILEKVG
jgi:predicted esterase